MQRLSSSGAAIMTCTVFNGSWENKLLSCLPACLPTLLEPALADVGKTRAASCGALEGGRCRDASNSAPHLRTRGRVAARNRPLMIPKDRLGPDKYPARPDIGIGAGSGSGKYTERSSQPLPPHHQPHPLSEAPTGYCACAVLVPPLPRFPRPPAQLAVA